MTPLPARTLRDEVLAAATRLFATRGFAGTAMRDVAEACACTKPALYHHFQSKEALFRAVVEHHFARLRGLITTTVSGAGAVRERLHAGVELFVGYCREAPLVMRLLQRVEVSPEDNAPCVASCQAREEHLGLLAELMRHGVATGELRADLDPLDAALAVAGTVRLQIERSLATGDWDLPRFHRTLDLLFEGLMNGTNP